MKIIVVGSSNTDMIIKVPRIPKPGETILGGKFSKAAGGKGANQAVAAARSGGDVTFVARVGQDMFGDNAIQGFEENNIVTGHVFRDPEAPSGVAEIFVSEDGENSIAVAPGANSNLSPEDIDNSEDAINSADILLMQLEIPLETVQAAADLAHEKNATIILNPAPATDLPDELLEKITILTPNESEAELLTGVKVVDKESADKAAKKLQNMGVQKVIITMGKSGAYVLSDSFSGIVSGYQVDAVDTTAAGDVFNGALSVAIAENKSLKEAVKFANAAAALSVQKLGAQPSAPGRAEIDKFIQDNN
jgi:ribokinase